MWKPQRPAPEDSPFLMQYIKHNYPKTFIACNLFMCDIAVDTRFSIRYFPLKAPNAHTHILTKHHHWMVLLLVPWFFNNFSLPFIVPALISSFLRFWVFGAPMLRLENHKTPVNTFSLCMPCIQLERLAHFRSRTINECDFCSLFPRFFCLGLSSLKLLYVKLKRFVHTF